jgi:hypothetical protein
MYDAFMDRSITNTNLIACVLFFEPPDSLIHHQVLGVLSTRQLSHYWSTIFERGHELEINSWWSLFASQNEKNNTTATIFIVCKDMRKNKAVRTDRIHISYSFIHSSVPLA